MFDCGGGQFESLSQETDKDGGVSFQVISSKLAGLHVNMYLVSIFMAAVFYPFTTCAGGFPGGWWTPYAAYFPVAAFQLWCFALPIMTSLKEKSDEFQEEYNRSFWCNGMETTTKLKDTSPDPRAPLAPSRKEAVSFLDCGEVQWAMYVFSLFDKFKDNIFLLQVLRCNNRLTPLWLDGFDGFLAPLRPVAQVLQLQGAVVLAYVWTFIFQLLYTQRIMRRNIAGENSYFNRHSLETTWKHAQYCSLHPATKPLERHDLAFQAGKVSKCYQQWKVMLEATREMGQEVINENLLQLWLQTSVYGLSLASKPCSQPIVVFQRDLGCPDVNVLPGIVIGLLALMPKFKKGFEKLCAYSDPEQLEKTGGREKEHLLETEVAAMIDFNAACRRNLCIFTALATFLFVWICTKLVMAHLCESHIWNLVGFKCAELS